MISYTLPEIRRLQASVIQAYAPDPKKSGAGPAGGRQQYQARLCHYRRRGYARAKISPEMHTVLVEVDSMNEGKTATETNASRHTWRVTTQIYAPMQLVPAGPELPDQLNFTTRLVPKCVSYPNMEVALLPRISSVLAVPELPSGYECAFLVMDLTTDSASDMHAVETAVAVFEDIIDSLSFQLGTVIRLGQSEILDISPPVAINDERPLVFFGGLPAGTNVRTQVAGSIQAVASVTLPDEMPHLDTRTAAALRWFIKALGTDLQHDVFIFLWIALEILVDLSPITVGAPYQARCNHQIKHCPECGESTSREVRGSTIRQYLEVSFGMDSETTKKLWRIRQMMHGAVSFESNTLQALPMLVQSLRSAVAEGIKRRLGVIAQALPVFLPAGSGAAVNGPIGMVSAKKIGLCDLQSLSNKVATLDSDQAPAGSQEHDSPAES